MILAAFVLIALLTLALAASVTLIVRDLAVEATTRPATRDDTNLPVAA